MRYFISQILIFGEAVSSCECWFVLGIFLAVVVFGDGERIYNILRNVLQGPGMCILPSDLENGEQKMLIHLKLW
jgi:hypothetical protein